jgi:hypothetical protein
VLCVSGGTIGIILGALRRSVCPLMHWNTPIRRPDRRGSRSARVFFFGIWREGIADPSRLSAT